MPVFALFSAASRSPAARWPVSSTGPRRSGVVLGLVAGKTIGVFGGTWLTTRLTKAELNKDLAWADVFAIATLAGIGFTVSLLIGGARLRR